MEIIYTPKFQKKFKALPEKIRGLFRKQELILQENWFDPRLHTKRLKEYGGSYSLRITRNYRALFYFSKGTIVLFVIGHRKDVYQ